MRSQTDSGRAFEYAIAHQIGRILSVDISPRVTFDSLREAFKEQPKAEQSKCIRAADEAITFLIAHDQRFEQAIGVYLPSTTVGKYGDVRDIVVQTSNKEGIGISAKHRHKAVKHSRLSPNIDFGKEWLGIPCSDIYKRDIAPIFKEIKEYEGGYWRDIADKDERFYVPLLKAFINELKRLQQSNPSKMSANLLQYLLGKHDFYKIVKENGEVSIQSYNFAGTLDWGNKIKLIGQIVQAGLKENSKTTVEVIFNNGWHLSFRIHSARSKIELSLKFDIQIIGLPQTVRSHVIKLK